MTAEELADHYLERRTLRPATERDYRNVARQLRSTLPNVESIQDLKEDDLILFRRRIIERASKVTWNTYRRHLSALLRHAVQYGFVTDNPIVGISQAAVPPRAYKTLPVPTLAKLLRLAETDSRFTPNWFWVAVLRTMYYSGMRLRQVVCLTWRDVDWEQNSLRLGWEGSKTRREWSVPTARFNDDLRIVHAQTCRIAVPSPEHQLFRLPLFLPPERCKVRHAMTEWHVTRFFRQLTKISGVTISAHRIRHTTATEMVKHHQHKGYDLTAVQHLLGHTDYRTTASYIHPDMAQLAAAVETLDKI